MDVTQDTRLLHTENGQIVHGTDAVVVDPATFVRITQEELRNNVPEFIKSRKELIALRRSLVYAHVAHNLDMMHAPDVARFAQLTIEHGSGIPHPDHIKAKILEIETLLQEYPNELF